MNMVCRILGHNEIAHSFYRTSSDFWERIHAGHDKPYSPKPPMLHITCKRCGELLDRRMPKKQFESLRGTLGRHDDRTN